jgi:hypothetical protein
MHAPKHVGHNVKTALSLALGTIKIKRLLEPKAAPARCELAQRQDQVKISLRQLPNFPY